ncbi:PREDICTED: uncharacterized protein LOC107332737 isoform X1 [Acropora digitifera]|uniref:uncharacterized protein LOC107332737 isoform X1 n=1 Tax=Acropora digitifera TaxID=70779 RepID=UPI00077A4CA1|nr:PREDICTED: uncharacterized protein LOC107332737 isoform X1 [Acropora digitifera]
MASTSCGTSRKSLELMFVCDEWKSTKGGLSTFNRYLAKSMAKYGRRPINVYCYLPQSDENDRQDARENGVSLLTAGKLPGNPSPLDWLKCPPKELPNPSVVLTHGRKFGPTGHFIVKMASSTCCWVHAVHVFGPDIGKYKSSSSKRDDPIEDNEKKHHNEIQLCEAADAVVTVGPRLRRRYIKCLPETKVIAITPGILEDYPLYEPSQERFSQVDKDEVFDVLMVGRAQLEDRKLKGYDIIAKALSSLGRKVRLTFVGSEPNQQTELENWFLRKAKIAKEQLTVCGYGDREKLIRNFKAADLFVLPSREEGFGMTALEALSCGIPILVSPNTGIAHVLKKVESGKKFIVASNDPDEWAKRIRDASMQEPRQRYEDARRLRENYGKTYPWEQACQDFVNLLEEVMKSKGGENRENLTSHLPNPVSSIPRAPLKEQATNIPDKPEDESPTILQTTMHNYIEKIFGKHSSTHNHRMRWGDITLHQDPQTKKEQLIGNVFGLETQSELDCDDLQAKAVDCFKRFRSHRPTEMNTPSSPFYLAVKRKRKAGDPVWYMKVPQAACKIGKMQ